MKCIALSPDGALLAAGGGSETVVWELATARVVARTKECAYALDFEDDRTLWLGMAYVHRWRFLEGEPVVVSTGLDHPIAVSRAKSLVAAADGGKVAFLSFDGRVIHTHSGPSEVRSLAFSEDGTRLAVGYTDSVLLVDPWSGRALRPDSPAGGSGLYVGSVPRSGGWLVARNAAEVALILTPDGKTQARAELMDYPNALRASPDGSRFAVACDKGVQVFDANDASELARVEHAGSWDALEFVSDARLAVGGFRAVHFVDLASRSFEDDAPTQDDGASAIAVAPNGSFVATAGGSDPRIVLWPSEGGTSRASFRSEHNVDQLAISPDSRTVAVCSWRALYLCDVESGEARSTDVELRHVAAAAFAPDGRLATIGEGGRVVWRNPSTGAELGVLVDSVTLGHERFAEPRLAFSSDGRFLACSRPGGRVLVVDTETGNKVLSRGARLAQAGNVSFAPDATHLAYLDDETIVVVDVPGGHVIHNHKAGVIADFALLADGQLAVVQHRGRVTVVDLASGKTRTLDEGPACAVADAKDGRVLIGYENGSAALIPLLPLAPGAVGRRPQGPPRATADGFVEASDDDPYRSPPALQGAPAREPAAQPDESALEEARQLFDLRHDGETLVVSVRWPRYRAARLQPWALGALVLLLVMLVGNASWKTFLGAAAAALIALVLEYRALAFLLNRTLIRMSPAELSVEPGPLRWRGGGRWSWNEIREVFVGGRSYELRVMLRSGKDVTLGPSGLDWRRTKALRVLIETEREKR